MILYISKDALLGVAPASTLHQFESHQEALGKKTPTRPSKPTINHINITLTFHVEKRIELYGNIIQYLIRIVNLQIN